MSRSAFYNHRRTCHASVAAENGSPMSCGYGGAKRMLPFMAKYASGVSEKKNLGIRFQAIVPQQMVLGTGVGNAGANAYAHAIGVKSQEFVAHFGAPMPPQEFGGKVVSVLDDQKYAKGFAFGLKGDTGVYNARGGSLSTGRHSLTRDRGAELLALAGELRPDLHRYCARLMESVIDGEDVVQDTLIRAFVALEDLEEAPPLRPWLFRIAHNRALDLLRSREVRMAEPIDVATDVADLAQPDPLEMLMHRRR